MTIKALKRDVDKLRVKLQYYEQFEVKAKKFDQLRVLVKEFFEIYEPEY